MKLNRSRITFALIALLLVGGGSAAFAVLTTPQPGRVALADLRQNKSAPMATATATTAPITTAPTTPPLFQSTATATTPPPPQPTKAIALTAGQGVDLNNCIVTSVTATANTFTMTCQGSIVTVDVTRATNFSGDAKSLSALPTGWSAEVQGVVQANGHVLATEVNASSGN